MKMRQLLMAGLIAWGLASCSKNTLEPDTTPPAAITDLRVTTSGEALTWTAPGDDGDLGLIAQYDIRYASGDLAAGWDSAVKLPFPGSPARAGKAETVALPVLGPGTWQFGVRSADEVPNWSELSNLATVTVIPDTTAPAPVMDLAVTGTSGLSVELAWTATGDDGAGGQAAAYDLRYAEGPITEQNWDSATRVDGVGAPKTAGAMETFAVIGLEPGIAYGFALVVSDDSGNESVLSNAASGSIPNPVRLETNTVVANQPDWSPDGKQIVFIGYQNQLYVVSAAGGAAVKYTDNPDGVSRPDWSPDGAKLAFSRRVLIDNTWSSSVLSVMDPEPNAPPQDLANHDTLQVGAPRWSPDGLAIAYDISYFDPPAPVVGSFYMISSTGGDPRLVLGSLRPAGLDWSPDGTKIVYSDGQDGVYDLWIMELGGSPSRLTTGAGNKGGPVWSPDGEAIAYLEGRGVWIVPASGGTPTQVDTGVSSVSVRWSPSGRSIAYDAWDGALSSIWIQRIR
jgi:WD40 repeat protein